MVAATATSALVRALFNSELFAQSTIRMPARKAAGTLQLSTTLGWSAVHSSLYSLLCAAGVQSISPLVDRLEKAGVQHTKSMSGRPAIFFRDPDANVLEVAEMGSWRE